MRYLNDCLFPFNIFSFQERKRNTENSNPYEFELLRPSIKVTTLLFKETKATIVINDF